jgi:hypothetical protein
LYFGLIQHPTQKGYWAQQGGFDLEGKDMPPFYRKASLESSIFLAMRDSCYMPPLQSPAYLLSALQPSQITPPGLPKSTPSAPVSQPLFPIIVNNNIPTQISPFSAPMLSTSIMSSSAAELKGSIDAHSGADALVTSNYQAPNIPGWICFTIDFCKSSLLVKTKAKKNI